MSKSRPRQHFTTPGIKEINLSLTIDVALRDLIQKQADKEGIYMDEYIYRQLSLGIPIRSLFEPLEEAMNTQFKMTERVEMIKRWISSEVTHLIKKKVTPE